MSLPLQLPWTSAQTRWKSQLDPLLANPVNDGSIIKDVKLIVGSNVINHLLQREQQGWILVDQQAAANIYRSAPFNNLTLTLTSSAAATVSILVF